MEPSWALPNWALPNWALPNSSENAGGATCRRRAASCTDISTFGAHSNLAQSNLAHSNRAHSNLAHSNLAHSNLTHSILAGVGWGGWGVEPIWPQSTPKFTLPNWLHIHRALMKGAKGIQPSDFSRNLSYMAWWFAVGKLPPPTFPHFSRPPARF